MNKFSIIAFALVAMLTPAISNASDNELVDLFRRLQTRMVKVYGAGGVQGLDSFQSGLLISDSGEVLTAWSTVLDVDKVRMLTWDGRRWDGEVVGVDQRTELAIIKIEADGLPFFDLAKKSEVQPGDRVFGISNLFNIATGDEGNSIQQGSIMARAPLSAQRGSFRTPYRGEALILDVMTNNPGAAGGALVDLNGDLVGVLGKELADTETGIWLNYATPLSAVRESVTAIREGKTSTVNPDELEMAERPHRLNALGIRMVPDVVAKTPAFVDQVAKNSIAESAGLEANDLILVVNDKRIDSRMSLERILMSIDRADVVRMLVQRDDELYTIELRP
jgi:serine protease Do